MSGSLQAAGLESSRDESKELIYLMIHEESWGCSSLSGILISVRDNGQNGRPQTFTFNPEDGTATINDLQDCTTYRIKAAFQNKDELGIYSDVLSVSTYKIRPASVETLQTSPATTHIDVSWVVSSSICDPDYFILRYSLYRKLACPSPETTLVQIEVNTTSTLFRLDGLEPYSRYKISVIAVNFIGESEPTTRSVDTVAGPPAAIRNVTVNPEKTSSTRLVFTWEPLNCRNVNGDFWYYYPRIFKFGNKKIINYYYFDNDITVSSVKFENLESCTTYELIIYARNRGVRDGGNLSVTTALTGVTFISASTFGYQNTIRVSWSVPSGCEVDYYRLSYQLISRRACPDVLVIDYEVNKLNVTSPLTSVFKNILNLENYATYNITIIAVIDGMESLPRSVQGNTDDGNPSGPPTKVRSTSTRKRSITFTWDKPACGYRNGPITSYDLILFDSAGGVVHQRNVSDSTTPETTIDGLIPYSNYSITVRAWNYELPGVYSPEFWAQTDEAKPGPPICVNLPASDQESITVEWMSPNPPLGRIIGYYLLYWETDDSSVTPIVRNVSFTCEDGLCSDINQRFSVIIPDLLPDRNYSIQASLIANCSFYLIIHDLALT
nr:receptor-type tyrosine-protein phosphatase F-like [Lytechinus pictus]